MTISTPPLEVEWQFDAPDLDAVEQWLRAQPAYAPVTLHDRGEKTQRDTYLDTADWRVFHAGYSLRLRARGDTTEVTLKALARTPDGGPVRRAEFSQPGDVDSLVDGDGPVGGRLQLILRGASLRPLFTVTTRRHIWTARSASSDLAEVALDDTTLSGDGTPSAFQRVEVEEVGTGGLTAAQTFVDALRVACSLTPAATSKFQAGLLAAGLQPALADLGPVDITPDDRAVDRAYAILRRRFGEFLANESGTALGEDPESLHQMRVATRRLRAALQVFEGVLPPPAVTAREELRWLAQVLGDVRDLDVQLEHLAALRRASPWDDANSLAPLVTQFERERDVARGTLLEALRSDRYAHLVESFRGQLIAGPPPDSLDTSSREAGSSIISQRYRRFRRDARLLRRRSPHVEYHAVRIRGKRLRYSLELFVDLYGHEGTAALASLRALQDLLGELQDLATTDDRLRALVRTHAAEMPPDTLVMVGRLIEQHRARAEELVGAFPRTLAPVLRRFARLRRSATPPHPPPPPEADTAGLDVAAGTDSVAPLSRAAASEAFPPPRQVMQLRDAASALVRRFRGDRP